MVLDILRQAGGHEIVGFVDSNREMIGRRIDGLEVLGHPDELPEIKARFGATGGVVAIGDNGVRRSFADRLEELGFELVSAIHPSANIATSASIGRNAVIAAGALVCAHCQIGDSVILNTGSIVDHESLVGTATHVCPGARVAGRVTIESGAFVGIGATIIQNVRVGYEAVVGAGAVVVSDVAPMSTVVGVPAREVKGVQKSASMESWMVPEYAATTRQPEPIPTTR